MSAPQTVPDTRRLPPRRAGRKWLVGLIVLLAVTLGLAWFAPAIVANTSLKDSFLRTATADVNGNVTVGSLSLGWLRPVGVTDLRITDAEGREVLAVPELRTERTLYQLATNRSEIGKVTITRPTLTITCGERTNLEDLFAKVPDVDIGPSRPAVTVEVTEARVFLAEGTDRPAAVLERGTATVTVPADTAEPIRVTATAEAAGASGKLEAVATVGQVAELSAKVDGFPLDGFGPLVRRFGPGTRIAGRASGELTARLGEAITVSGKPELSDLDLSAPWLGPDRVRLSRAVAPLDVTISADTIAVRKGTEIDCDVGKVAFSGEFSPSDSPERLFSRPGLEVVADLDVAKLSATIPRILHLREGTELTAGHVHADLTSTAGPRGTGWKGKVETGSLRGTRAGQPLAWEKPFRAVFDVHFRPDGLPEFDTLQCQADFIGLNARGTIREFVAAANLDLDKLSAHLDEFIDLGGAHLSGTGKMTADLRPSPDDGPAGLNVYLNLERFAYRDGSGHELDEPSLAVRLFVAGRFSPTGPIPIETANLQVTAAEGKDRLTLTVFEPVPDLRAAHAGKLRVTLAGDAARWKRRVGPFAGLPPEWVIAGTGTADGQVELSPDAVRSPKFTAEINDLRFRGLGLTIDERQPVKLDSGLTLDRNSGAVVLSDVGLASETAGVSARAIEIAPLPGGGWGAKGEVAYTADVDRVRRAIGLTPEPSGADAVTGLADGQLAFTIGPDGLVEFRGTATAADLTIGPPRDPVWVEKRVKFSGAGEWNPAEDSVRCERLRVERDGLTVEARGTVAKLSSPAATIDVNGTTAYDLARLEPQLRSVLGPTARAAGRETKPFRLTGPLASRGGRFPGLSGNAAVGWEELRAYGFEVGPAELRAELGDDRVRFSPVKATFGGGTVNVAPSVKLEPGYELTVEPGRVVSRATLTPAACADAIGFVLPPLAHAAAVEGLVSVDVARNAIPLADPNRADIRGTVTVHEATVSAGPLVTEIATALGAKNTTFTLTREQAVPFRVENGRVFHDNFTVMVEQTTLRTSGSVGLDGTLVLAVDVQVPPRLAQQLFPNNPLIREALARQTIRLPVGGTLAKPRLEPGAFQAAVRQLTRETAREAGGGLFRRGQERLLEELEKKLAPPPEPK